MEKEIKTKTTTIIHRAHNKVSKLHLTLSYYFPQLWGKAPIRTASKQEGRTCRNPQLSRGSQPAPLGGEAVIKA